MTDLGTGIKAAERSTHRPPGDQLIASRGSDSGPVSVSKQKLARIAGGFYLTLVVCSWFGGWVWSRTIESNDAAATADNIRTSTGLFRAALTAELVGATAFLFTAMALYLLLGDVHRLVAAAMVAIVTASAAIMSLNLINNYAALSIATNEAFTTAFGAERADQLALLFTDLKDNGFFLAQMTFGLWLLPLGYLVVRSRYFPRALGIMLMIACFSMLTEMFAHLLDSPDVVSAITLPISAIGELSFFVWLIVKGVRTPGRSTGERTSPA